MIPIPRLKAVASLLLVTSLASASESTSLAGPSDTDSIGNFMIQLDNDLFTGDDSDYTNGFRFAMGGELGAEPNYDNLRDALRRFSGDESSYGFLDKLYGFNTRDLSYSWGLGITQQMYTPDNYQALTPQPGQRPYAAWLGVEFSMQARNADSLSSVGLALGVTGEWALGEPAQDIVHHDLSNSNLFNGWDSQAPEEVTVDLLLDHKRRIHFLDDLEWGKFGMDGYTEYGGSLGTKRTAFYVGGVVRAGWNLPHTYIVPRLQAATYGNQYFSDDSPHDGGLRAYLLAGARGSLVLHDATLDGPLFQDWRHSVNSEPLVGEVLLGIGVGMGNWDLIYSHVARSDEFESQEVNQEFGSIQLVWQRPF